jgi:naphthoate synthase
MNADSDHIAGIQTLAFDGLELYVKTEEASEGAAAFLEKRPPNFSPRH